MSDFDKEAEREKLREKYGDETEKREATQQMSELLLQGATMTNRHCDTCGDPIFRYEDQLFCPTCQSAEGDATGETAGQDDGAAADGQDAKATDPGDGERDATTRAGDDATVQTGSDATARTGGDATGRESAAGSGSEPPREASTPDRRPVVAGGRDESDLASAERDLRTALARFARRGAETDDPRTAREHLKAAREAAEALAALRR